jgi:multisubunit Na+/H+ antiporter MnhB subunit
MRILVPSCILFMLLSAWLYSEKKSPGFFLSVAACLLIIVALLITLLVEVPIDNQITTWTAETIPSGLGSNTRTLAMFSHRSHLRVSSELR